MVDSAPSRRAPPPSDALGIALRRFAGHRAYAAFEERPLRIAHLTDQHVGRVTPMRVQQGAVSLTNAQSPDLVVLTGDFVCHSHDYLDALQEVIEGFAAPVFAVLGNHDHWTGADEVRRVLRRAGAEVLDNAHTTITLANHQRLQVVGLDDAYTGHADVERATRGLDARIPTLGLSHIAEMADPLWEEGVPLVLSGHTHAGQITLARLHEWSIGRLAGHRYVHGLYGSRGGPPGRAGIAHGERGASAVMAASEEARGAVYVGAGIGAAVMPIRLGERARREVTLFDLGLRPEALEEHHAEQAPLPGRAPTPRQQARRRQQVIDKAKRRARTG